MRSLGHSPKMFRVLILYKLCTPSPSLFKGSWDFWKIIEERGWRFSVRIGVQSIFGGSILEVEDMHCFSFVMVYGLSSNNILYWTSNQFLYVNRTCYIFSTLSNNFLSWIDFYVYHMFNWVSSGKNGTKKCQKREVVQAI